MESSLDQWINTLHGLGATQGAQQPKINSENKMKNANSRIHCDVIRSAESARSFPSDRIPNFAMTSAENSEGEQEKYTEVHEHGYYQYTSKTEETMRSSHTVMQESPRKIRSPAGKRREHVAKDSSPLQRRFQFFQSTKSSDDNQTLPNELLDAIISCDKQEGKFITNYILLQRCATL